MALQSLPFPMGDGEVPFDDNTIRKILIDLCTQTVDSLESEKLEIKGWCNGEKDLAEKISEVSACLANANGGVILIGVSEQHEDRRKFSPCPHPNATPEWLVARIHDQTSPPVECSCIDISGLLSQVLGVAGRNALAVRVPKKAYVSAHITTKGISKIRVGKECRPYFTAEDDRSKLIVPELTRDDISIGSVDYAIAQHEKKFGTLRAQWADQWDFLSQARLLQRINSDGESNPKFKIPLATLLLFGKQASLAHFVPYFETIVVSDRGDYRFKKNIVESVKELCSYEGPIFSCMSQLVDRAVIKELVVNAYVHRCYRNGGPVIVRIDGSQLEIQSPGELAGGLQANELIHCTPVYRNLLLADGARFGGLCDKIGRGIDLIYSGLLFKGLGPPEFESDNGSFTARISSKGSDEFREYVRVRGQTVSQLDEVIVLRCLWNKDHETMSTLASAMQRSRDVAQRVIEGMRRKLILDYYGGAEEVRLSDIVKRDIHDVLHGNQTSMDRMLWGQ